MYECTTPIRLREIAILRQASKAKSEYELHQHRFIAMNNGITEAEIEIICNEAKVHQLNEKECLICQMADEIEITATLTNETREALINEFGEKQFSELVIVTSFYSCVARVLNATRLQIEQENPLAKASDPN